MGVGLQDAQLVSAEDSLCRETTHKHTADAKGIVRGDERTAVCSAPGSAGKPSTKILSRKER